MFNQKLVLIPNFYWEYNDLYKYYFVNLKICQLPRGYNNWLNKSEHYITATCKSRNEKSGNGIRGNDGNAGNQGGHVGNQGGNVGNECGDVGNAENVGNGVGMQGIRVAMRGIRVEVWGIKVAMRGIMVAMQGVRVGMR